MVKQANRKRQSGPAFKEGDKVFVSTKNFKLKKPSRKLGPKKLGPFQVLSMPTKVNAKLKLPPTMKVNPIFHVSLLEPAPRDAPLNETDEAEEEIEYEVEQIMGHRICQGRHEYKIRWKGYLPQHDTWEPLKNLEHSRELIQEYHQANPKTGKAPLGSPQG